MEKTSPLREQGPGYGVTPHPRLTAGACNSLYGLTKDEIAIVAKQAPCVRGLCTKLVASLVFQANDAGCIDQKLGVNELLYAMEMAYPWWQ